MGINGIKKGNMGVHGVLNVLLWYCQIIKKEVRDEPLFFMQGGDGKLNERQRRFADEYIISGNIY